jgi:hypothetical protein
MCGDGKGPAIRTLFYTASAALLNGYRIALGAGPIDDKSSPGLSRVGELHISKWD